MISWQPHGRAFRINDPTAFQSLIMTRYFPKMRKLASLQRQFNLYSFERLTRDGPDAGAYYHEAFLRHRPGLSDRRMFRKRIKGTGYKACSNPEAEPDLYMLPSMDEVMMGRKERASAVSSTPVSPPQYKAAAVVSAMSSRSLHPVAEYQSSSYVGGTRNLEDNDAGVVTESKRSSSFSSNSEYSAQCNHQAPAQASIAPAQVPSNLFMPQATMDRFLAMPEATQESYLQDFFSMNGPTPMSPREQGSNHMSTIAPPNAKTNALMLMPPSAGDSMAISAGRCQQQQRRSAPSSQESDHPILLEFADLWDSFTTHEG